MRATKLNDTYRCLWCSSINETIKTEWCSCATSHRTLVCASCSRCFCAAPAPWIKRFWEHASDEMIARRWQAMKPQPKMYSDEVQLRGPVILVVDDSRVIHLVIDNILSSFEGTVLHAHDGAEGLRIARAVKPDILLTDALLPKLDGRDLARLLKSDPTTAGIKTVVMTALYKGLRYRNEAFKEFKVDGYLEKPIGAAQLRTLIAELLPAAHPELHSIAS